MRTFYKIAWAKYARLRPQTHIVCKQFFLYFPFWILNIFKQSGLFRCFHFKEGALLVLEYAVLPLTLYKHRDISCRIIDEKNRQECGNLLDNGVRMNINKCGTKKKKNNCREHKTLPAKQKHVQTFTEVIPHYIYIYI